MKITLITATYNSQKTIVECLESVSEQTYHNIEHIVIDGSSTDQTLALVKAASPATKYISEPDKGIYDALNKGIKMASGDVIGFLHSDDIFSSPDSVKNIVDLFNTNKNIHGAYGNLIYVKNEDTNKVVREWKSKAFNPKSIKWGWMPPHPTLFLKKEVYQKYGLFDISYQISGDYDFMLRIKKDKESKFAFIPKVITKMRMGGVSTCGLDSIAKYKEDIRVLRNHNFRYVYLVLLAKIFRKLPQLLKRYKLNPLIQGAPLRHRLAASLQYIW